MQSFTFNLARLRHLFLLFTLVVLSACNPSEISPVPGTTVPPTPVEQSIPAQPEATTPPAETQPAETQPAATGAQLCPEVPRPALVMHTGDATLTVVSPDDSARCEVALAAIPNGPIIAAHGRIFYPILDPTTQTMVLWQVAPDGSNTPLPFTSQTVANFGPYTFTVAEDGSKIAWAYADVIVVEGEGRRYINHLWVSALDGSNKVTLLDGVESSEFHFQPLRFSPDGATLLYTMQPTGVGGSWMAFTGRHQAAGTIPVAGGEPTTLLDCGEMELFLCIGDVAPDGQNVAYTDANKVVHVVSADGTLVNSLEAPGTDFVGFPTFSPTGQLAFISSTLHLDDMGLELPAPGHISLVDAPYTGEAEALVSGDGIATLWQWLDETHLIYNSLTSQESHMVVVSLEGESQPLSAYPVTLLR